LGRKKIFSILSGFLVLLALAIPVSPVSAAASLTVSPTSGKVGDTVYLSGSGFAEEENFLVFFSNRSAGVGTSILNLAAYAEVGWGVISGLGNLRETEVTIPGILDSGSSSPENVIGGLYYFYVTYAGAPSIVARVSFEVAGTAGITLSPTSGHVGDTLTVNGSYFTQGQVVTITYDDVSKATVSVPSSGSFSTTITVPPGVAGTHQIAAKVGTSVISQASFEVQPKLVLSPASAPPGVQVTVTGTGFASSKTVSLRLGSQIVTPSPAPVTDASGSFSASFTVPQLLPASYTLTAQDALGNSATATFAVRFTLSLSPISGHVGDSVTVSGSNFTPGQVSVTFDDVNKATVTVPSSGSFSVTFSVPEATSGPHQIEVKSGTTTLAAVSFEVEPKITLSASEGPAGSQVTVSGTGFAGGKTVSLSLGSQAVTTPPSSPQTDNKGSFSASFTVPQLLPGSYTLTAEDALGNSATATFGINPNITISPVSGHVGDTITVEGENFAPGSVSITFDGATKVTVNIPASGSFSASFIVTPVTCGIYQIEVKSGTTTIARASFEVLPRITLSEAEAVVGGRITVSGTGFAAGKDVDLSIDGQTLSTALTGNNGSFSASFTVPQLLPGSYTVVALDSSGNSATATFKVNPTIAINPASGHVGDTVAVSGSNFAPGQVTIMFDSIQVAAVTVPSSGSFSVTLTVPEAALGTHQIEVRSGTATIQASFEVQPKLMLDRSQAKVGDVVTINGTGFASGGALSMTLDGQPLSTLSSIILNANGSFSVAFTVPTLGGGTHEVKASQGSAVASVSFELFLGLEINPKPTSASPANVGDVVTLSGWGFKPSATVEIRLDDIILEPALTDSNGSFSISIAVPGLLRGGEHAVRVTDGEVSAETAIFVEVTPPTAVQLSLPADGDRAGKRPHFDWEDVTDPSGLTYTLQIARDSAFRDIALEKSGLRSSEYVLTDEEVLEPLEEGGLYYWRVRAVDGAGNAGPWSNIASFTVSTSFWEGLPGWTTYLWIALGVIAAGALGFYLGRRSVYWGTM